ncbi:DUF1003 domain-containing protein [Rhizorhapis suberifaciens]|uniref:Putative membrane protein n=1 Tax=Rhizorhapis suberifaciens TaxID=13656 RepID=A0A840HVA6_9SPHN|nr:DUF1003 domain-containing protein [Rhizorhapis suberifaciens]MBB4641893.1 putative membrane protein [Rhizorhapis suberifaciens]
MEQERLNTALERNIKAISERRQREAEEATLKDRIAAGIASFAGNMSFVVLHVVIYGVWLLINSGLFSIEPFDPDFVQLAMVASVEALFLSTFILMTQNRMSAAADKRADLDLHIVLLTEHELTRLADLLMRVAEKLDIPVESEPALEEARRDISPEAVLDEIERQSGDGSAT